MLFEYTEKEFEEARKNDPKYFFGLELISTDKTGTKHYEAAHTCWKCGGTGEYLNFGRCFACCGSGYNECKIKIYTDEHRKKLDEDRIKRQNKKIEIRKRNSEKLNKIFFEKEGYNSEGKTWAFIKPGYIQKEFADKMREIGAKRIFGNVFLFTTPQNNFNCIEISAEESCDKDVSDVFVSYKTFFWQDMIESVKVKENEKSKYYGTVGEKVKELELTFLRTFHYETQFGWMSIYLFEDSDGNQFKWNTSSGFDHVLDEGEKIKINGTIKAHSEYDGIKQTVLTRCKLVAQEKEKDDRNL